MKNRIRVIGTVQDGAIEDEVIKRLQLVIGETYCRYFGGNHHLTFIWLTIPRGQAFLAAKPSTTSVLQLPVQDLLADHIRHDFMSEVSAQWQKNTGCSKNEIILSCPDASYAKHYFDKVNERFNASTKVFIQIKLLLRLMIGKLKKGYLNTSINF